MIILLDLAMIGFHVAANAGEQQGSKSFSERSSPRAWNSGKSVAYNWFGDLSHDRYNRAFI